MKKLLFLLFPLGCFAQDSALTFTQVVEIPGQSKEQLFIKGRQWLNEILRDSKVSLRIADKETGELTGKTYISAYWNYSRGKREGTASITYSMDFSLFVKDGKYKYIFTNFIEVDIYGEPTGGMLLTTADTVLRKVPLVKPERITADWRAKKKGLSEYMAAMTYMLKEAMIKESKSDF